MVVGVIVDEPWTHPRVAHESPGVGPHLGGIVGTCYTSFPSELDNLNGAVGTLSSEAVGIGCEAFGEDDLGAVFEWGDVFGAQTEKGIASTVSMNEFQSVSTFLRMCRSRQSARRSMLKRLIGGMEV